MDRDTQLSLDTPQTLDQVFTKRSSLEARSLRVEEATATFAFKRLITPALSCAIILALFLQSLPPNLEAGHFLSQVDDNYLDRGARRIASPDWLQIRGRCLTVLVTESNYVGGSDGEETQRIGTSGADCGGSRSGIRPVRRL
jgi:hypothetical protein